MDVHLELVQFSVLRKKELQATILDSSHIWFIAGFKSFQGVKLDKV